MDRLFEPFYRGAVRTGRTSGAGLGLSIVRAIALACGGLVVEVRLLVISSTLDNSAAVLPGTVPAG